MATDQRTLVETYAAQQASITATLIRVLLNLWLPFTWWDNKHMVNAYAARSAVEVDNALATMRRYAREYALEQLRQADADIPSDLPVLNSYERGGTPIVEVYERPAKQRAYIEAQARIKDAKKKAAKRAEKAAKEAEREREKAREQALADFDMLADAFNNATLPDTAEKPTKVEKTPEQAGNDAFTKRLTSLVEHDVSATARDEIHRIFTASAAVIGWRRIPHPELSQYGSCSLCIAAASRVYQSDLMPMHGNCKCTVAPVTKTHDAGFTLNKEDLEFVYGAGGGTTSASHLKRGRFKVNEHGEYGPVLIRDGDHFTDYHEVNTRSGTDFEPFKRQTEAGTKAMWAGLRAQSEVAIKHLYAARRDGSDKVDLGEGEVTVFDVDQAINYHRALIARAKAHGA